MTPGEAIVLSGRGGRGTYTSEQGELFASIVGRLQRSAEGLVEVVSASSKTAAGEVLPQVGSIITGTVVRVTNKQCDVQILCVGDTPRSRHGVQGFIAQGEHPRV